MSGPHELKSLDLQALLLQHIELLSELRERLTEETQALAAGEHERLLRIADEKQGLTLGLTAASGALGAHLRAGGYAADAEGLASCVRDHPGEQANELHDSALALMRDCASHNQTNGQILERRRKATDEALRILFGNSDAGTRYHPTGRVDGVRRNLFFGEA